MAAYGALCAEFYDLDKPNAPPAALAFYVDQARKSGGRVLEPMCGSGRFLLPMSRAGVLIDGVDSSAAMVDACRSRAGRLGLRVGIYLQEFALLELARRYSMAFIPSGSIGLIAEGEELHRALSRTRSHLETNGVLFLELAADDVALDSPAELESRTVQCPDGATITYTYITSRRTNPDRICFSGAYRKCKGLRDIDTEEEELVLAVHSTRTILSELSACGFRSTRVSTAADQTFLAESGCILIEARA